jgi:hypothetical protein
MQQSKIANLYKKTKNTRKTETKDKDVEINPPTIPSANVTETTNVDSSKKPSTYERQKRTSRPDESFEIPDTKRHGKRAKIEKSPERPAVSEGGGGSNLNDLKTNNTEESKVVENFSKSSMKTAVSESDGTISDISSKTKNIIDKILNKKSGETSEKEFNYLNVKQFLNNSPNKHFKSRLSVSNTNTEIKKTPAAEGKLSSRTMEIMEGLKKEKKEKMERLNRFEREKTKERTRSESSFSMRFKYEELIKEDRELLLPPKYKHLVVLQNHLDFTINAMKLRGKGPLSFENIKAAFELTYKL